MHISSTFMWPFFLHLFQTSSLCWHESHCKGDLIWLLDIFCWGRDYRKLSRLDRISVQSSVHSQAGPKKSSEHKRLAVLAFLANASSSFLPRPFCSSFPQHWAEGAGTVRTGEFAPSKATLRKLKSESKYVCTDCVSSRLQAFCLKASLSPWRAFLYSKQAEEEMHSVTSH